jgi:hypothetical protein
MAGEQIPDAKKKRQQRAAKKPGKKSQAEIDAAIEALRVHWLAAQQELYRLILTNGSLSKEERDTLFIAANKVVVETITWNGFQLLELRKKFERARAGNARSGRTVKTAAWHAIAERLACELWERKPDLSAAETLRIIWKSFEAELTQAELEPVKPGTVQKHIGKIVGMTEQ